MFGPTVDCGEDTSVSWGCITVVLDNAVLHGTSLPEHHTGTCITRDDKQMKDL